MTLAEMNKLVWGRAGRLVWDPDVDKTMVWERPRMRAWEQVGQRTRVLVGQPVVKKLKESI